MIRRVVIAGSRTVSPSVEEIDDAIGKLPLDFGGTPIYLPGDWTEVICGCAPGGDRAGQRWAEAKQIPVHHEPITEALVKQYGKWLAPKMRNRLMAERGDAAIVFWDGTSSGSADMACRMLARGKAVEVIPWKKAKGVRR